MDDSTTNLFDGEEEPQEPKPNRACERRSATPRPVPAPEPEVATSPGPALDPFDPERLRLNPTEAAKMIGFKQRILTVKCGKPSNMEFVRTHPDPAFWINTVIIDDKINNETYMLSPELRPVLPDFAKPARLWLAVTRQGVPFLWRAMLPDPNRPNDWHTSMMDAQEVAVDSWIRVQSNQAAGYYQVHEATGKIPEPEWPELSFQEVLKLAFKIRMIDSVEHPYVQELLGAV